MPLPIIVRLAATAILSFLAGVGTFNAVYDDPLAGLELVRVERMDISDEVSVTGVVTPKDEADLSFDIGGRLSRFFVEVGDVVPAGAPLAILDRSEAEFLLRQAEAELRREEAVLKELRRGPTPEDLAVSEAKAASASAALRDAIEGSYIALDEAVYRYTDHLFDNPRSVFPRLTIPVTDQELENRINVARARLEELLRSWRDVAFKVPASADLPLTAARGREVIGEARDFLADLSHAVNSQTPDGEHSASDIAGYRADVGSARDSVDAAISGLRAAESDFLISSRELSLKRAGTSAEAIAAGEAKVAAATAAAAIKRHDLSRRTLYAPFSGTVTRRKGNLGEYVSAATPVFSLISKDAFEVEARVPEVDVARLAVGNPAVITLDALPNVSYEGVLRSIDPAATTVEGVPTYTVTFRFSEVPERLKSGMTADVSAVVASKTEATALPIRAVQNDGEGKSFVEVVDRSTGTVSERIVATGIKDPRGFVEIVSGLREGESIVLRRAR